VTRWLTILILFSVALAGVAEPASAQRRPGPRPTTTDGPETDGEDRPRGPARREGRSSVRRPGGGSRRAAMLKALIKRDLAWIGEHDKRNDMTAWIDRVEQLLSSEDPGDWIRLWQVHRRVQQWRQLSEDDLAKAFEEVRLEFHSCDLANRAREARGDAREKLKQQLREVIERQFDLRIEVQKAALGAHEKRLSEIEERLKTHERLREELVAKRFEKLLDSKTEPPDPLEDVLTEPRGNGHAAKPPTHESHKPTDRPPPPRGEYKRPRGRPNLARRLKQRLDANLKWLDAHNLKALAERLRAIRETGSSDSTLLLWRAHRWIEQQKRLLDRPDTDPKEALKSVRLTFRIAEIVRQLRKPEVVDRPALELELRKALGQQFDARQRRGRTLLRIMRSELKKLQRGIKKQVRNRRRLIARRVKHLLDPEQDPAEPELVPGEMFNPPPKPRR
jgi:hypothetical protein